MKFILSPEELCLQKWENNMRYGAAKENTYTSFALVWQAGVSTKSQIKVALKHPQQNVSVVTREKNGDVILLSLEM